MLVTDISQLRRPCLPVKDIRDGAEVARKLQVVLEKHNKKTTKAYHKFMGQGRSFQLGVGLAANQIGIQKRVVVIRKGARFISLMNPVIVDWCKERIPFVEGCLSLPEQEFHMWRHLWVEVDTLNVGRLRFGPAAGEGFSSEAIFRSVVAQHEISHCFGLLASDFTNPDYPTPNEWEKWSANGGTNDSDRNGGPV